MQTRIMYNVLTQFTHSTTTFKFAIIDGAMYCTISYFQVPLEACGGSTLTRIDRQLMLEPSSITWQQSVYENSMTFSGHWFC
jgi:hypothetical protein